MKLGSTLFLKAVVSLLGLSVFGLCVIVLPRLILNEMAGDFDYLPILLGMYLPAVPFFIAILQTLKLLEYIDKNLVFSKLSVQALRRIKFSAVSIAALYAAGMPYLYMVGERDDAPGVILFGLVIVFASSVIATFAGVLQQLLQKAVAIKSENDLTV